MFGPSYLGLPLEIYELIFSFLKLDDLKTCTLVSKEWLDSLEDPVFWRKAVMVITPESCEDLPHSRRVRVMETVRVGNFESISSHHQAIRSSLAEISRREDLALKTLKFSGYKFGVKISLPMDTQILSLFVKKVVNFDLSMVNLTTEELDAIFAAVGRRAGDGEKLRSLNLRRSPVSGLSLSPARLAQVVANNLQELNMSGTQPSLGQVKEILTEITTSSRFSLKRLNLAYNPTVSLVPQELLGEAVSRLSEVNLSGVNLSTEQIEVIFRAINSTNTDSLEVLSLGKVDMSEVDSRLTGVTICKLRSVQLWNTKLNSWQLKEIFQIIHERKDRRLKMLDLEGNDVHSVLPETLGKAVLCLKSVDLHNCKVTAEQVDFIFGRLAEVPPPQRTLKNITLTDKESVNYKENQSLALNLNILRGHKMFLITKRFLQFHGLNDKKNWNFL